MIRLRDFVDYHLPWPEPFTPDYQAVNLGKWRCVPTPEAGHIMGYWRPRNYVPSGWMFMEKQKNNWLKWMSLTPMELESHQPHIAAAKGTVVVAGLGMGFYLYNILRKPEVKRVIVLEQDKNVVNLFQRAIKREQWQHLPKFELVMGDACNYKPEFEVDFLYADIWPFLGYEDALPITQSIQENVKAKEVGFWGQEFDFSSWIMKHKRKIQEATLKDYREFCTDIDLPLIEQRNRKYPQLSAAAVIFQTSINKVVDKRDQLLLIAEGIEILNKINIISSVLDDLPLPYSWTKEE